MQFRLLYFFYFIFLRYFSIPVNIIATFWIFIFYVSETLSEIVSVLFVQIYGERKWSIWPYVVFCHWISGLSDLNRKKNIHTSLIRPSSTYAKLRKLKFRGGNYESLKLTKFSKLFIRNETFHDFWILSFVPQNARWNFEQRRKKLPWGRGNRKTEGNFSFCFGKKFFLRNFRKRQVDSFLSRYSNSSYTSQL